MNNHPTRADCEAALSYILDAPKLRAPIDVLCFRPDYGERSFPDSIRVSAARGIEGERWLRDPWLKLPDGRADPRIQISVLPKRVADLCWRNRDVTPHPGDTLITDLDLTTANMPVGTRLQVGSAVIEVSDVFNNGCAKWYAHYGADSVKWINHRPYRPLRLRGILCRVVVDGEIRKNDLVEKLDADQQRTAQSAG